jgi:cell division septal protein FtsQ
MPRYKTKLKPKSKPKRSLLPLWLALGGLVLILIAGWSILGNNAQPKANIEVQGAPRLKVEKDIIDHGDLKLGSQIRDDIRVTNVGDQTLAFSEAPYLEVKEGC